MLDGLRALLHLPAEGDSLKLIHIHEDVAAKLGEAEELKQKYEKYLAEHPTKFKVEFELKAKYEKYLAEHPTKFKVEFELKGMARGTSKNEVIHELLDNATYEYIALATHPKDHIGSVADYLIKNYKGNIICFKGESADRNLMYA